MVSGKWTVVSGQWLVAVAIGSWQVAVEAVLVSILPWVLVVMSVFLESIFESV